MACRVLLLPSALLLLSLCTLVTAYDGASCCLLANKTNSFLNTAQHPLLEGTVCGQVYNPDLPPAPDVFVPYEFCKANCGGIGLSKPSAPGEWVAPIVQFILPAVIFSAAIPRRLKLTFKNTDDIWWLGLSKFIAAVLLQFGYEVAIDSRGCLSPAGTAILFLEVVTLIPRTLWRLLQVFVDNVLWIIAIVIGAGPMLIGGLYEAVLDHKILNSIRKRDHIVRNIHSDNDVKEQLQLLIIMVLGNLEERGDPIEHTYAELENHDDEEQQLKNEARLLSLLRAQSDFGTAVGAPVLFYLGAFIYTILDLQSDPSDQDSAISLAFGVEWMIVVHVAIVSGCLLAANNPATSTAIVGQGDPERKKPDNKDISKYPHDLVGKLRLCKDWIVFYTFSESYDTTYQPVWMWRRGANKSLKLKQSLALTTNLSHSSKEHLAVGWTWWLGIWVFAFVLIALPPSAGALVAYATPPIGWSCRSLSCIIYAGSQVVLCTSYIIRHHRHHKYAGTDRPDPWYTRIFTRDWWKVILLFIWQLVSVYCPLLFSLVSCIGGTAMQIIGVFRNCFCYVNTPMWFNLGNAAVNLASDTKDARNSTVNWRSMGIVATAFMVATSALGWWYQDFVRRRYIEAVHNLYTKEVVQESWISQQWEGMKLKWKVSTWHPFVAWLKVRFRAVHVASTVLPLHSMASPTGLHAHPTTGQGPYDPLPSEPNANDPAVMIPSGDLGSGSAIASSSEMIAPMRRQSTFERSIMTTFNGQYHQLDDTDPSH